MNIRLEAINEDSWKDCIQLEVADHQKSYIPSNAYSIAESKYETSMRLYGVYQDDRMVGFASYILDEQGDMNLYKLMVDKNEQGKGYGKEALRQLMDLMKEETTKNEIWLSLHPENQAAIQLYQNYGFVQELTGLEAEDEIFFKYTF